MLLHVYSGISVYKKWVLNVIEFSTYFNILVLTASKFYVQQVGGNHEALAYISISVQLVIFICSLVHHAVMECHIVDKMKARKWYKKQFSLNSNIHLLNDQCQYEAPNQRVTYSEVNIRAPGTQSKLNSDPNRVELKAVFQSQ